MLTDLEVFALRAERLPDSLRALLYPELDDPQLDSTQTQTQTGAHDGAIRFAGIVLKAHRNDGWPGDVEGDVLQQAAVDCGLIEERRVDEPCGDACTCAGEADFPTACYFNTEAGKACIETAISAERGTRDEVK